VSGPDQRREDRRAVSLALDQKREVRNTGSGVDACGTRRNRVEPVPCLLLVDRTLLRRSSIRRTLDRTPPDDLTKEAQRNAVAAERQGGNHL
jgi:hypothetical protein